MEKLETSPEIFEDNGDILRLGERYGDIFLIQDGWAIRHKLSTTGNRTVTNFILPGDFVCLHSLLFEFADHSITAITPLRASRIAPRSFLAAMEGGPRLPLAIAWCAAKEEALIEEHLLNTAQRSAYERVAHVLIELWRRLELLELTEDGTFPLPITQAELADGLGLSQWHVNRVLRDLRREGLIDVSRNSKRQIHILDKERLTRAAGFDEVFLHFTEMPSRTAAIVNRE